MCHPHLSSVRQVGTVESYEDFAAWRNGLSNGEPCGVVPRSIAYLLGVAEVRYNLTLP